MKRTGKDGSMKKTFSKKIAGITAVLLMSLLLIPAGTLRASGAGTNEMLDPARTDGSIDLTLTNPATGKPVTGGKLGLYKVADVLVDNGFVYTYRSSFSEAGDPPATDSELNEDLAARLYEIATKYSLSPDVTSKKVGADGTVSFSNLEVGLYLVVQTAKADGGLSVDPFLVTVPTRNADGTLDYSVDASPKPGAVTTPTETTTATTESTATTATTTTTTITTVVKKLPQTGQLWWPVMLMGCIGALLLVTGWSVRRKA